MNYEEVFRPSVFSLTEYIAGKTIEEVKRELGLKEIIKLASNENPYGPHPAALEAIREELPNIFMYPEKSFLELKSVLAEFNGVKFENVVVGHGSETIIQIIPQLFVNPGDEVIMGDKTYGRYEEASRLMDGVIKYVPLKNFTYDLEGIARSVTDKTKIIWVCNPNNPTGTIVKSQEVREFLNQIPSRVVVVFDQAYFEYVEDPEYADGVRFLKEGYPNVIVLRTFSKAYGLAGMRLGYALMPEKIRQMLDTIKESFNLNRLSIVAGPACLKGKKWLNEVIRSNSEGRAYLFRKFKEMGLNAVPSQANFILVDVGQNAQDLFQRMMKKGVIIRPATGWGYDQYIRVTVGTPEENEIFISCLKEELA
ncbi:MAG: histidinol-phosphate transaminase [Dehalobacterium sp.]